MINKSVNLDKKNFTIEIINNNSYQKTQNLMSRRSFILEEKIKNFKIKEYRQKVKEFDKKHSILQNNSVNYGETENSLLFQSTPIQTTNNFKENNLPSKSKNQEQAKNKIVIPCEEENTHIYKDFFTEVKISKENRIMSNFSYASFQNLVGENTCYINVILHLLYNFIDIDALLLSLFRIEKAIEEEYNKDNNVTIVTEQVTSYETPEPIQEDSKYQDKNIKNKNMNLNKNPYILSNTSIFQKIKTPSYLNIDNNGEKVEEINEESKLNELLASLGEILNEYESHIKISEDEQVKITKINTLKFRIILEMFSEQRFKRNDIADPVEFLLYLLELLNEIFNKEIHDNFYLELIEKTKCTNSSCMKINERKYDKDNFIYTIYINELLSFINSSSIEIEKYRNNLFKYSYQLFLEDDINCDVCKKKLEKKLICQTEPNYLLINFVWKEQNPCLEDILKILFIIPLKDNMNSLFFYKSKKDLLVHSSRNISSYINKIDPNNIINYYLLSIVFFNYNFCHYIIAIYNPLNNLFVLFNDEYVKEFNNLLDLYKDLTAEILKNNDKGLFYPVMLVYSKENIYGTENNIIKYTPGKSEYNKLKNYCNNALNEFREKKKLNDEQKKMNYQNYVRAQLEIEKNEQMKRKNLQNYYNNQNKFYTQQPESKKVEIIQRKESSKSITLLNNSNQQNYIYQMCSTEGPKETKENLNEPEQSTFFSKEQIINKIDKFIQEKNNNNYKNSNVQKNPDGVNFSEAKERPNKNNFEENQENEEEEIVDERVETKNLPFSSIMKSLSIRSNRFGQIKSPKMENDNNNKKIFPNEFLKIAGKNNREKNKKKFVEEKKYNRTYREEENYLNEIKWTLKSDNKKK